MFTLLSLHVNMWSFYLRYEKIPEEWEPPKPKPYHDVVSILKLSNYKCQWILEYSVLEHCSSFQIFNYSNLDAVNILLNSFYFKISFQYKPMFHWLWVFFFFKFREICVTSCKNQTVMISSVLFMMEEREQPSTRTLPGNLRLLKNEQ